MTKLNLEEPRWDQSTYIGRAYHFFTITNPLNILCSSGELEKSKHIITQYRRGEDVGLTEDELWKAKHIYDSAFHPDTGEKMTLIGRMSAQVPMNMSITGCMITFYKSTSAVVFWQWINQSFNAIVNYTNRSGESPIGTTQLATCYVLATGGALGTALGLNSLVKTLPPIVGRLVPFVAVATANCINIPMMRLRELREGIALVDDNGNNVGTSKKAAKYGIGAVCISRILMAAPSMIVPAFVMNSLDRRGFLKRFKWINAPLQIVLCGICLTFATPVCCAIFPQKSSIAVSKLEPDVQMKISEFPDPPKTVYYNKGL